MIESASTLIEIERGFEDIEKRTGIERVPGFSPPHIRLQWLCSSSRSLSLLLGSMTQPLTVSAPSATDSDLPVPDITIKYGDKALLSVVMKKGRTFNTPSLFERAGVDGSALKKPLLSDVVEAGETCPAPLNISDPSILLNVMLSILDDKTVNDIASISYEAPFERLRHVAIQAHVTGRESEADIVWLALPSHGLSKSESSAVTASLSSAGDAIILPFLYFEEDISLSEQNVSYAGGDTIRQLIKEHGRLFESYDKASVFPILPLPAASGESLHDRSDYLEATLDRAWHDTVVSGIGRSLWRQSVENRYKELLDVILKPPESIGALLRQKSLLIEINRLPEMETTAPDIKILQDLQAKGIEIYAAETAAKEEKRIAETATLHEKATTSLIAFLENPSLRDILGEEEKNVASLIESIRKHDVFENEKRREKTLSSVDNIYNSAASSLTALKQESNKLLKEQTKALESIPKVVTDDETEKEEQATFFWEQFIHISLEKVKPNIPSKEIEKLIKEFRNDFNDYVSLTPPDEKEFKKCLTDKWPSVAKSCKKRMSSLMDDTHQLWGIMLEQRLLELEEFRKKNKLGGSAISIISELPDKRRPILKETLNVVIKKPGFMTSVFRDKDGDKWRKETITDLKKRRQSSSKPMEKKSLTGSRVFRAR